MAAWCLLPVVALIALNLWATVVVTRDSLSSVGQRAAQIAMVWAVPLVGALLVLHLEKQRGGKSLGRYPEERDQGDDDLPSGRRRRRADSLHGEIGEGAADGDADD